MTQLGAILKKNYLEKKSMTLNGDKAQDVNHATTLDIKEEQEYMSYLN